MDDFRETGETARLRAQEEIYQKASAALSDKVSIGSYYYQEYIREGECLTRYTCVQTSYDETLYNSQ